MKEISKASKILCGVLVGGMLISVGAPLLASDTTSTTALTAAVEQFKGGPGGPGGRGGPGGMQQVSDEDLSGLVSSGVIDQTTADALKAYMDKQRSERKDQNPPSGVAKPEERADIWSEAVTSGIITEDQAVSIRSALQEAREKARQEQVAKAISALVSDQIITQERADKVTAFLQAQDEARVAEQAKMKAMTQEEREAKDSARKAEMEKIKAMTDDERKAYMQAKQADRKSPLSRLVTDGTLTQDQASALEKALFSHREAGPEPEKG